MTETKHVFSIREPRWMKRATLVDAYTALAAATVNAGDAKAAQAWANCALEMEPRNAGALVCRWFAREALGDKQGALQDALNAAETGDAYVIASLGLAYAKGVITTRDDRKAISYLLAAAEKRSVLALVTLACWLWMGQGISKDEHRARLLLEDAVAVTEYLYLERVEGPISKARALSVLGMMAEKGEAGFTASTSVAIDYYRQSAEMGVYVPGMYNYAHALLFLDKTTPGRREMAFQWILRALCKNPAHKLSLKLIVRCFRHGVGTARDEAQAVEFERKLEKLQ